MIRFLVFVIVPLVWMVIYPMGSEKNLSEIYISTLVSFRPPSVKWVTQLTFFLSKLYFVNLIEFSVKKKP
jgi:hypothetical protein